MNPSLSSVTVFPPVEKLTKVRLEQSPRRKSSFTGEFMEYTDTLSNLQEKLVSTKQIIKNLSPSNLDCAKKELYEGRQKEGSFWEKLDQMRTSKQLLSCDSTKTTLAGHFQKQLETLIISTEEHLFTYNKALAELDDKIRRSLLEQDKKQHPPLLRQPAHSTLQTMSTWEKICTYFKRSRY